MTAMARMAALALALGAAAVVGSPGAVEAQVCALGETGVKASLRFKDPVPADLVYSSTPGVTPKLTLVLQLRFCGPGDFITLEGTRTTDYMRRLFFTRGGVTIGNTTETIAHINERYCRSVNGVRQSPPLAVFPAEVISAGTVVEYTLDDARTAYDLRQQDSYAVQASFRLFSASPPALFTGCRGFGTQPLINLFDPDNGEVAVVSNTLEFGIGAAAPPTTVLTAQSPAPNANGWSRQDVTLTLTATGGGGARSITAIVNGVETVYPGATASVVIATEGVNSVTWFATSNAGVQETAPPPIIVRIDKTTPSVAFGAPSPAPNSAGWNTGTVTIPFTVTDTTSGVATVAVTPTGIPAANGTVVLSAEGASVTGTVTTTDNADNLAAVTSPAVKIDRTAPTVTCSVSPNRLWPPTRRLIPITATVNVADTLSGPAGFKLMSVTSSERDSGLGGGDVPNDIQGFVPGTASVRGSLRAERDPSGNGRVYTLTYQGLDQAGNTQTCAATVTVPHDQGN
ncbi:MAG TPA: hypothetical protein VGT02_08850 [Methylomirabilota bacterium]|jgi:hypothetical protein|nr:hypothetical protein [Methylomirabilota bacterium]